VNQIKVQQVQNYKMGEKQKTFGWQQPQGLPGNMEENGEYA